jgi:hypothetical protein
MILDAALELATAGYALFPIRPGDKRPPLVKSGFYAATTDPAYLRYWWCSKWPEANIAARTGDRLAVVDVDPRNGGTLDAVTDLGLSLDTRTVRTPAGGWQMHYCVDAPVRSRSGALAPGVDVKADGGYVLLPPSQRTDGSYRWQLGLDTPLLAADAEVLNQVNVTRTADGHPLGARRRKRPEDVREGERHDQAVLWCAWFASEGCEPDEVADLTWQVVARFADPVPLGDPGIESVIAWVNAREATHRATLLAEIKT